MSENKQKDIDRFIDGVLTVFNASPLDVISKIGALRVVERVAIDNIIGSREEFDHDDDLPSDGPSRPRTDTGQNT